MKIISESNPEKARKEIQKSDSKPIVVIARDDSFNREMLEYGKFDVLLSPEKEAIKSSVRQLNSGFNHVLAAIATKNNIAVGIDLDEIRALPQRQKAERLAKIRQNIEICRKAQTKLAVRSNDKKETTHVLLSLGASTQQAAAAEIIR